jgi:DAHP synthetase I family
MPSQRAITIGRLLARQRVSRHLDCWPMRDLESCSCPGDEPCPGGDCRTATLNLIYKSSFDKSNRTSLVGARGQTMRDGLAVLAEIRETFGCPVLTDVHAPEQCAPAAETVDVLQIPAFLCRQTDLLIAAARTGQPVNLKRTSSSRPGT